MRQEPGFTEDAKNLSIIAGSALVAVVLTGALFAVQMRPGEMRVRTSVRPLEAPRRVESRVLVLRRGSGNDRLYGTVRTADGRTWVGYIRWDRNEGSWTDVLDASKPRDRGGPSASGIRFGHIAKLDVLSRDAALLTLRSGSHVRLTGNASDLGEGLRALDVESSDGSHADFGWDDLSEVDFSAAPAAPPEEARIFGTLTTRSGMQFTGYVDWDVDEIYTTDVLDGDDPSGARRSIPFGRISSIERESRRASRVTLTDGTTVVLDGTNDVDDRNSGISVSDATLGQVSVDWHDFRSVRFREGNEDASLTDFDGGQPITGTVRTEDGRELEGRVVWDDDESSTWEMLNGEQRGVRFEIEFGQIDRIVKLGHGVEVTMRDGRSFELTGSNDVNGDNRGISVRDGDGTHEIDWGDFAELRLSH